MTAATLPADETTTDASPSFLTMIAQTWPLLIGVGLLNVGNGLQATLLSVRAGLDGFANEITGLLMAGFYLGFLLGAIWTPRAVKSVGQIRVFAALASLGSVAILIQATYVEPVLWTTMRVLTGFCFAGIFVISESWLNQASDNANRGRLLATYMIISFAGVGIGQALMLTARPETAVLFMISSVLISIAAVPMLLSASRSPPQIEAQPIKLVRLFSVSPLGTLGTFAAGMINGSVFGMAAVYAQARGFTIAETSGLVVVLISGAAVLQWPIGRLSDVIDRRRTIAIAAFATALTGALAAIMADVSSVGFLLAMGLFGGFGLSIHALCLAHTNDYLEPTELVGASSGLVFILAVGSVIGPLVSGFLIGRVGPAGYPWWLATLGTAIFLYTLYRMMQRESLPAEAQGPFVAVTAQASPVAVQVAEEFHADEIQAEAEAEAELQPSDDVESLGNGKAERVENGDPPGSGRQS